MATSGWILWSGNLYLSPGKPLSSIEIPTGKPKVMVGVCVCPVKNWGGWVGCWLREKAILSICFKRRVSSRKECGKGTDRWFLDAHLTPEPDESSLPSSCIHHPRRFQIIQFLEKSGWEKREQEIKTKCIFSWIYLMTILRKNKIWDLDSLWVSFKLSYFCLAI